MATMLYFFDWIVWYYREYACWYQGQKCKQHCKCYLHLHTSWASPFTRLMYNGFGTKKYKVHNAEINIKLILHIFHHNSLKLQDGNLIISLSSLLCGEKDKLNI